MSFATAVMFGNAESECAKLGSAAICGGAVFLPDMVARVKDGYGYGYSPGGRAEPVDDGEEVAEDRLLLDISTAEYGGLIWVCERCRTKCAAVLCVYEWLGSVVRGWVVAAAAPRGGDTE